MVKKKYVSMASSIRINKNILVHLAWLAFLFHSFILKLEGT